MKKQLYDVLKEVKQDKKDNPSTTSFKFKTDIWEYFNDSKDQTVVEFGTHIGQTTRILSFLFKKVYTINNNENIKAKELNKDRTNITYLNHDLYSGKLPPIQDEINVFFIDAIHETETVISDINTAFSLNCCPECYIIFDDYGLMPSVKLAVYEALNNKSLTLVKYIGHSPGHDFGQERILFDYEGLITKVNFQQ